MSDARNRDSATLEAPPVWRLMLAAKDMLHLVERFGGPVVDLVIRLWIGPVFLFSGLLKVADWQTALLLASNEYPVSWLAPEVAAVVGATIEVIGGAALILGLGTRVAALAMLALTLVVQFEYQALNEHVYWVLLLGWFVVRGAGALSLDRLLAPGLARSAVPFAGALAAALAATARVGAPLYLLALRLGLAGMLFLAARNVAESLTGQPGLLRLDFTALPLFAGAGGPLGFVPAAVIPALLALGLATRAGGALLVLWSLGALLLGEYTELARGDLGYWALFGLLFAFRSHGALAVDALLLHEAAAQAPELDAKARMRLPHIVVVGAGFGGVTLAKALRHTPCRVTLVDRRNYHLFQPLLYQVATATLAPSDIATPIRSLFRDQPNVQVLMARVGDVDVGARAVIADDQRITYDYLVLATGARHAYFGKDAWEADAPGIKKVSDATEVRRRLLTAFEAAETASDEAARRAWLTFCIVGGGPTGVELAGAIAELARKGLEGEFRSIDPAAARVVLIEAGPRVLASFAEDMSAAAQRQLAALGVEVKTASRVEQVDATGVTVGGEHIPARTVLWAAGVMASPAAKWLKAEADRAGRVKVGPHLNVIGREGVFAIGDTAAADAWEGKPVPGLAPAAKQGAVHVAKVLRARLSGRPEPAPFTYVHQGSLATIGRAAAVADFGRIKLTGPLAWWLWGAVHVLFLAEMRARASVVMQWGWSYLTYRQSTRLITGASE
ncbi:MAG: DoxX family membrane protein [Alphaproteobacteria bacterium]|nr:DoxX family membrane protein [Alphaproteobacteria bacterium]